MTFSLFTRCRAPVEMPAAEPEPWPETGATWTHEGVTVAERYYNQAYAVILVYTSDSDRRSAYAVVCLGCHLASDRDSKRIYALRYSLWEAARVANEHATTCRALPRDLPERPNDTAAREQLHACVRRFRSRGRDTRLRLSDLDLIRLTLQRTNDWIAQELQQLAVDQPEILRTERRNGDVSYYARHLPQD